MNRILNEKYNQVVLDQHYFDAIKKEDKKTLRELLTLKQREGGYQAGYFSGSLGDRGTVYKRAEQNGIWTTQHKESAETYANMGGNQGGVVRKLAVHFQRPLDLTPLGEQTTPLQIRQFLAKMGVNLPDMYYDAFTKEAESEQQEHWFTYAIIDGYDWKVDRAKAFQVIMHAGYDSLLLADTHYGEQSHSLVLFHSWQAKLDNLVTVNNNEIIPLGDRFDTDNPDIRY